MLLQDVRKANSRPAAPYSLYTPARKITLGILTQENRL